MRVEQCPQVRWVPVVDSAGHRHMEMRWTVPSKREAMFFGGGFGVGLTVADLTPPSPELGPPVTAVPSLGELLPVYARTAAEKAAELQRVQRAKAELAAYE